MEKDNEIKIDRDLKVRLLKALQVGILDLEDFPEFTKGCGRVNISIDSKDIVLR